MAPSCMQRLAIILSSYNYKLMFCPGVKHANDDSMSRLPFQSDDAEKSSVIENQF